MPAEVIMPALGVAQETGVVVQWRKRPGDAVEKGEPLLEVETDKAVVDVEAPASGILAQVTAEDGATVPVGERIALILLGGEPEPPADAAVESAAAAPTAVEVAPAESASASAPAVAGPNVAPEAFAGLPSASPKARRLAAEAGLDLAAIAGSGPGGAVLAGDLSVAGAATGEELEVSRTWRVMAERTAQAWTAPHFYLTREVLAGRLLDWRAALAARGERATVTDLLVKLAALTLKRHPHVASAWRDGRLLRGPRLSVGIAVATEQGLAVPVIPDADLKAIGEIADWREAVVGRARDHRLTPVDLEGGVFTISNLGMHGVDSFSAILNGGQAAILAVGRIAERPIARDGRLEVAQTMVLTLGCDHRAVDGARGAMFLKDLVEAIEDPSSISV
jgi:pyruvate dehydrogenase E2 component (dihydrolipoamide acetyltransferase)